MRSGQKTPVRTGNTLRRRWAWPPSGLLRYAPPRLRAAKPSETLAPGAESTYNNQPNGDLSELTKKTAPAGSAFRATSGVSSATVQLVALGSRVRTSRR